jgi:purine-binding chemotaxis protein CheW
MNDTANLTEYVTFVAGGQMFGLPIERVQDVFRPANITRVPLAGSEIAGVLNLRGRIVTAIHLSARLDLAADKTATPKASAANASGSNASGTMAIGIECGPESFGLLVESVGEVLKLAESDSEPNPLNLDRNLARVSTGVFRLDGQLLVVLDVDRVLDLGTEAAAA